MALLKRIKHDWTRIKSDGNGNPRYVVHFLALVPDLDTPEIWDEHGIGTISWKYQQAVKRDNKIGGRKFHNKSYGGGIVFQSYELRETEKAIKSVIPKATN